MHGRITAIIDGVYTNKIEEISPQDSQYEMTKHNPEYLIQFANNLINYMDDIQADHKAWFIAQINNIAYQLWDSGEIESLKNLYSYSSRHMDNTSYRSILNIGKLPKMLVVMLYRIRALLRSPVKSNR